MGIIIHYAQAGGFAGLSQTCDLDSDKLPPDEARQLVELVDQADVFHLSEPKTQSEHVIYDGMSYSLDVARDGQRKTLHLRDGTIPPQIEPLLGFIRSRAKYKPGFS